MPTAGELRLEQAHQRDLATIGAGVMSGVANLALGADPAAVSTWFFTALDAIMARVQTGYAQARRAGTGYIQSRATMAGADVDLRAGSLSTAQVRTSLEVTGPVAFKRAIAAGADDEEALLSMATQMSGSAQRLAIAGDRDVLEQTIAHGKGVIGYRRVLGGPGCGFCAMLASRGAVYLSRESASTSRSGLRFHDHCRCHVEPMFRHEPDPPDVQRLQRQWQRITAGETGQDKAVAWRRYWENDLVDRSKLRLAAAKAGPPSPVPGLPRPAPGVVVRSGLDAKRSLTGLQEAWAAEAKRITGRNLSVEIPTGTSLQTAKEYAEGVLRGLERFPDAAVSRIRFGQMAADQYAEAGSREITFNSSWASMRNRPELVAGLQNDIAGWAQGRNGWSTRAAGNPMALSLHEFSHVLDIDNLGERIHSRALSLATRRAALEGIGVDDLIARDISVYATSSAHELIAESFTDVMLRGQAASPLARDIFDLLEAEYFKAGGRITPAFGTFAAKAAPNLAKMTVPQLRALAAERGVTLPAKALKADIVRALEEAKPTAPTYAARQQALREALRGSPSDVTRIEGGVRATTERLTYPDGTRIIRKDYGTTDPVSARVAADAEELAARILDAVGVRVPAVVRVNPHTVAMEFVDGKTGGASGVLTAPAGVKESVDGRLLGLADALLGNRDRNLGNWMRTPGGRLVAIDNGDAFEFGERAAAGNPFASYLMSGNSWARTIELPEGVDLRALRVRLEAMRPEFERLTHDRWHAEVMGRLDEIERRAIVPPPGAARWLGNVDLPAAEAERIGQLVQAKSRREILDEIVQLRAEGATSRALANRIRGRAALPNTYDVAPQVDDVFRDELLAAVDNGTIDDVVRRHLAALDTSRPLTDSFDRAANAALAERAALDAARPIQRFPWESPERDALEEYGQNTAKLINLGLRGNKREFERWKDVIADIDRALASSPLSHDLVLWRGLRSAQDLFGGSLPRAGDLSGFTWTEAGFTSTSALESKALGFVRDGGVLIRLVAPKGVGGVALSDASFEAEVLLSRGLQFRVVRDYGLIRDGSVRRLDVEIVPAVVEKPLAKRTVTELRALAKERNITLPPRATKAQIVERLEAPPLTPAQIKAAEQKALRDAARARNLQIEQATGTARLLAEVDELLVKKAEARVIRQRLDPKLIDAEQVFANADPAVREALAEALASGDMAKVRAAVTRLTTKAKIKVVGGKAGAKVKFDPATMESLGAEIADGAPVTVVTRGASVTLPDGTVVQVRKAQVTPVVPAPKPLLKPLTRREIWIAEAKRKVPVLEARLKALPIGDPGRVSIQHSLDNARAIIEQKPGAAHYNWSVPSWDVVEGSRILRPPTQAELATHIDSAVVPAVRGATRTDVVRELERQAELTPRSMLHFRGVEDPANFDLVNHSNSYAYYQSHARWVSIKPDWPSQRADLERSYIADITSNWHPPTSRTGLEAIMAHEYGHHVTYRLIEAPLVEQRRMIKLLDETFGLNGYLVRQFRRDPDIQKVITDFVKGPYAVGRVDRHVSKYAQKNYQEFFAEVWSEYTTMGDQARPQVKAIGDMMRRMAELSDVVLTP